MKVLQDTGQYSKSFHNSRFAMHNLMKFGLPQNALTKQIEGYSQ